MKKTLPYSFKRNQNHSATFCLRPALNIILALTLALTLFGFLPLMLSAATIDDLQFTLINGDTEYSVSAKDTASIAGAVEIPATYNDKPVTEIGASGFANSVALQAVSFAQESNVHTINDNAFYNCSALDAISLPESLSALGRRAFGRCAELTNITIPSGVTVLLSSLFSECRKLSTILLHNGITSIGNNAFLYCTALQSLDLSNRLNSIGSFAFGYSGLSEITIPASVSSIGDYAFLDCNTLSSITFIGSAPTIETDTFSNTGLHLGGFTITIYDTHEASYADWRNTYTFNVIPAPDASVFLYAQTSYDPTTQALSIVTQNEPSGVTINLEQANSLSGTWSALNSSTYAQSENTDTGTVTRTVSIDPDANAKGFYRLASATASTQ